MPNAINFSQSVRVAMPNSIDFEKNLPHWLRVKLAIHRLRCGKRNGINYVVRVWVSSLLNMSKPLQDHLHYSASLAIYHFANLSRLLHSLFPQSTKAVSTLMRFPKYGFFFVFDNASIDSRLHYSFDVFSVVHTKTLENDRVAGCGVN